MPQITAQTHVALVDWNWTGHHATYFAHFATALSQLGARVLPLCPAPDAFHRLIASSPLNQHAQTANICQASRLAPQRVTALRPYRLRFALQAVQHFGGIGRRLRQWQRQNQQRIQLVLFPCVYDADFEFFKLAERRLAFPWAGLYMNSRPFRMPGTVMPFTARLPCPEKIFTTKSLKVAGVLDESCATGLQNLAQKPVLVFPDITDVSLPDCSDLTSGLAGKLRQWAAGRPIVSLVGHLQRTKGLVEFTRAARDSRLQNVFFFLGGEVNWTEIPLGTKNELLDAWANATNLATHLTSLSERTVNGVINASNVVYAAYTDFPNSSNILNKAAYFQRPVIVSDGFVMAERTRAFELGETVAEGSQEDIVATIQRMTAPQYFVQRTRHPDLDQFLHNHSYARLLEVLQQILELV